MGHWGAPIRRVERPRHASLLVSFFGQALILNQEAALSIPSLPSCGGPRHPSSSWPRWRLIASRPHLGSCSLAQQAVQLGCLPRLSVIGHHAGQIYVPQVNWLLMLCLGLYSPCEARKDWRGLRAGQRTMTITTFFSGWPEAGGGLVAVAGGPLTLFFWSSSLVPHRGLASKIKQGLVSPPGQTVPCSS
jgi:hypothetical protein